MDHSIKHARSKLVTMRMEDRNEVLSINLRRHTVAYCLVAGIIQLILVENVFPEQFSGAP